MSKTPPMNTLPLNGREGTPEPELTSNREKRPRDEDGKDDDYDRSDRRRRREDDEDRERRGESRRNGGEGRDRDRDRDYERERERRHRHRDDDRERDHDRGHRRHHDDETEEEREERRRRRKERERERERDRERDHDDRRSARHESRELLPDHGAGKDEGRLKEDGVRGLERDRERERERGSQSQSNRDRSRESHRSHRSHREPRERRYSRDEGNGGSDYKRMSREDREAERERRDREMREERREAARLRDERQHHMDRDRGYDRRPPYGRRDPRDDYNSPRPRRGSPSYDHNGPPSAGPPGGPPPPPRSPPPDNIDPASQVWQTIDRETRSVFVSQIAARITSADLGLFFEDKLGRESVRDARIVTDRLSRRSKGIGYVELADAKYVPKAIALSGAIIMGIPIIIQPTESERNREGKTIEQLVAEATKALEAERPRREREGGPRRDGPVFPPLSANLRVGPGFDPNANSEAAVPFHRLFLQNVAYALTEEDVRAVFEPFGEIVFVDKHVDHHGSPRGTAYVQFVELRDAQTALDAMNGFEIAGRTLKVMAITERSGIEDDMDERKGGKYGGPRLDARGRMALMQKLARTEDATTGSASPAPVARPALPPQQRTDPTPFVIVSNMFNPEEETDRNWDLDLAEDVKGELESKYGKVKRIKVDKMSAAGEVYVEFAEGTRFADMAIRGLNGRYFGGKQLKAEFISEALFTAHL